MKNEVYKKQMKKIRPSDELIEKTIANIKKVNNENNAKNPNKLKNADKLRRLVAGTAAALTLSVGSVGAYMAITGNSLLSILGLEKASVNYENESVAISDQYNTVIENEYTKIKLEKIACDETFLILEYNVKIKDTAITGIQNKDENFITRTGYNYGQETNSINLGFSENIYVNGEYVKCYSCIAQKIEDSENEYKFYDIINLMEIDENNLKVSVQILALRFDGYQFMVTDANNNYLLNLTRNPNNNDKFESISFKNDNEEVIVKNVMNTSFASYVTVDVNVSNISSENCINNINFISKNSNNEEIESYVFLNKYVVKTENDTVYDIINDSVQTTEKNPAKDLYLLNSKNKEKADNLVTFDTKFSNANAEMEFVILYPNIMTDENTINCLVTRNGETIVPNIEIDVSEQINSNLAINDISLVNYTDSKVNDFINNNEYINKQKNYITNEYYNKDAKLIDIENYEICGIKTGMSMEEAIKNLQEYYNENNVYIDCNSYYTSSYSMYNDGLIQIYTEDNKVDTINYYNVIPSYNLKVSDIINSYYSEEKMIKTNMHDEINGIAILYGKDEYMKDNKNDRKQYAYVNLDAAGRITYLFYVDDKGNSISFDVDASTKIITRICIN